VKGFEFDAIKCDNTQFASSAVSFALLEYWEYFVAY
jgi:hypothetical protein